MGTLDLCFYSLFSIEVLTNSETHGSIAYVVKNTYCGCSSVVERNLAKVDVARSNRVSRLIEFRFTKVKGLLTLEDLFVRSTVHHLPY